MANMDLEVDTLQIAQARNSSKSILTDTLDSRLDAMNYAVIGLSGLWEGPNHDTFLKAFDARYIALRNFNHMLESYLSAMRKARAAYDECEYNTSKYAK